MWHQITAVGSLGQDCSLRYSAGGTPIASFSMATNRQYTNSEGQKIKETTWLRVAVFNKQAEACQQFLRKGDEVLVVGRLVSDPATGGPKVFTRQDGTMGASFEIVADTVRFLKTKGSSTKPAESDIPTEEAVEF